jgi:hypothetical protein
MGGGIPIGRIFIGPRYVEILDELLLAATVPSKE